MKRHREKGLCNVHVDPVKWWLLWLREDPAADSRVKAFVKLYTEGEVGVFQFFKVSVAALHLSFC